MGPKTKLSLPFLAETKNDGMDLEEPMLWSRLCPLGNLATATIGDVQKVLFSFLVLKASIFDCKQKSEDEKSFSLISGNGCKIVALSICVFDENENEFRSVSTGHVSNMQTT